MMKRSLLPTWLRNFWSDTSGVVSLEFILMMPPLFMTYMAVYVYFDGYRQAAVNLKAAYTISDLISRETNVVTDGYIDSMYSLIQELTRSSNPVRLRVSVVRWDEDDDRYYLDWSEDRGFPNELTNNNIGDIEAQLPNMPDNERVILVETRNTFVPLFNVGLDDIFLDNFVFTRPRFVSQVVFEGMNNGAGNDHEDGTGT